LIARPFTVKTRTFLWLLLFLVPVALAILLSISQRREQGLLRMRIDQLNALLAARRSERGAIVRQLRDLEAQRSSLEAEIKRLPANLPPWERGVLEAASRAEKMADQGAGKGPGSGPPPIVISRPNEPFFRQLLGDPSYAAAVVTLEKQDMKARWGLLLADLKLDPAMEDKLVDLLTQRQMAYFDAAGISASSGPVGNLMAPTTHLINQEIAETFGPQVAAQIQEANLTQRLSQGVDDLAIRLNSTPAPLQPAQADQLNALLAQSFDGKRPDPGWVVPASVIDQAQAFLAPAQIGMLRQLQEEQQAAQTVSQTRAARGPDGRR
jgi:hypothetical protein